MLQVPIDIDIADISPRAQWISHYDGLADDDEVMRGEWYDELASDDYNVAEVG